MRWTAQTHYSGNELFELGFSNVGRENLVSRKVSLYGVKGELGSFNRIDDYCILKGELHLGSHLHIANFVVVSGAQAPVTMGDFSTLAIRTTIFTGSDDYSATTLGTATRALPEFTRPLDGPVTLGKAVIVGAHCVILPNVTMLDGVSVGAGCVIPPGGVYREGTLIRSTARLNLPKGGDIVIGEKKRDAAKLRAMIDKCLEADGAKSAGPE